MKLFFWRKQTKVWGMTLPVVLSKGRHTISLSLTSNDDLDAMVVRDNGQVIGYRQVTKNPPKSKESK